VAEPAPEDAIASYDEALTELGAGSDAQSTERAIELLLGKGVALQRVGRAAEAIVVYDSAARRYLAVLADGDDPGEALWRAALALHYKVQSLCALERWAEAADVGPQLGAVLGDVQAPPDVVPARPGPARPEAAPSEQALAAKTVEVLDQGECWRWFEGREDAPSERMRARALELYRLTAPWLVRRAENPGPGAASAAALMLRDVADGYALLAGYPIGSDRGQLPLPRKAEHERARVIRMFGIDAWAAGLGHRLPLPEVGAEPAQRRDPRSLADAPDFNRGLLEALCSYGLLALMCDSARGRSALENRNFVVYAAWQLSRARGWIRSFGPRGEGVSFGTAWLFVAEAYFSAAGGEVSSSAELIPGRSMLRAIVREDDGYPWLREQDVELPAWLLADEDE
jgi:tetratricopeptide (TPR) repeat protein